MIISGLRNFLSWVHNNALISHSHVAPTSFRPQIYTPLRGHSVFGIELVSALRPGPATWAKWVVLILVGFLGWVTILWRSPRRVKYTIASYFGALISSRRQLDNEDKEPFNKLIAVKCHVSYVISPEPPYADTGRTSYARDPYL